MEQTIAQKLEGTQILSKIKKFGGKWNDDYAIYVFPDGSAGRFSDIENGAQIRDGFGNPVSKFHIVEIPEEGLE